MSKHMKLVVDNEVIEIEDGCILYCSPPEGMDNGGQAVCCSWSKSSPELKQAFLKLRQQWSAMLTSFMKDNGEALGSTAVHNSPTSRYHGDGGQAGSEVLYLDEDLRRAEIAEVSTVLPPNQADTVKALQKEQILIFTDGACSGNPGPGGWGAVIKTSGGEMRELSGGAKNTTNNQMELTAAIEALKTLKSPSNVTLTTDSQYMQKGITEWIHNWKRNGWRTADKKPVKSIELWREMDALNQKHEIQWQWVRGHNGHPENERSDELAQAAITTLAR